MDYFFFEIVMGWGLENLCRYWPNRVLILLMEVPYPMGGQLRYRDG